MQREITFVSVDAFSWGLVLGSIASADSNIPVDYTQSNNAQVMGVGKTIMQLDSKNRALTNVSNLASQSVVARNISVVIKDYQFGSSQTEQSWKQWRSVKDTGVLVVGLVHGDCRGNNSEGKYRIQINDKRIDLEHMKENLFSQVDCEINHATFK